MNKNRRTPSKTPKSLQKKPRLDMVIKSTQSHSRQHSSSPEELSANLISSGSSTTSNDTDKEIPETPEGSPSSVISASPSPSPSLPPSSSPANLIEDFITPASLEHVPSCSSNQLENSLIHQIESDSSSSSSCDGFNATNLIESDSETTTPQDQQHRLLPSALTQPSRRRPSVIQPKDVVAIPLIVNPPKHPLTIITSRPVPLRNGLADALKKVLVDYRSRENLWQYDNKLGVDPPAAGELVHVKSIKKFHSYCLLVEVQRGQGDDTQALLLNVHWGSGFGGMRAGDKLIVNFRKTEPIRFNDQLVHFFPFVVEQRGQVEEAQKD